MTVLAERRRLLAALACSLAAPLPGCSLFGPRDVVPYCPDDPALSSKETPLTIDVHAHIFNGTDLQIRRFMEMVASRDDTMGRGARALGGLLQDLAWERAPTAVEERKLLREIQAELAKCEAPALGRRLRALKQGGYEIALRELQSKSRALAAGARAPAAAPLIDRLPPTYEEFARLRSMPRGAFETFEVSLLGIIDFVVQHFQYRYVTAYDYLDTFSRGNERKVDLVVASLVDYDWWLAQGAPTPSSLEDQVQAMADIAIATGGRVHAFVPFDPLRELMARRRRRPGPLALVRDAVEKHGAMGVKIYPPMGFAPYGNSGGRVWHGKTWLPDVASEPGFGTDLDAILREFFGWCIEKQVPVLAHANQSNGPDPEFEKLALADKWKIALDALDVNEAKLRINFGHFGDTTPASGSGRAEEFVKLMKARRMDPGALAFADASYFSEVLDDPSALQTALERLYLLPQDRPALLADRLMYGSDWEMSLVERNVQTYLSAFDTVMGRVEASLTKRNPDFRGLKRRFFGVNAANFLGLRTGEQNRARMEEFYDGRVKPYWITKVDAL